MLTLRVALCQPSVPHHLAIQSVIFTPSLSLSASVPMPDRYENQSTEQPEVFPGQMEWLYDTMDETQPQGDRRPRRGFPCGTFLILGIGLAILAGLSWLLFRATPSCQRPAACNQHAHPHRGFALPVADDFAGGAADHDTHRAPDS